MKTAAVIKPLLPNRMNLTSSYGMTSRLGTTNRRARPGHYDDGGIKDISMLNTRSAQLYCVLATTSPNRLHEPHSAALRVEDGFKALGQMFVP